MKIDSSVISRLNRVIRSDRVIDDMSHFLTIFFFCSFVVFLVRLRLLFLLLLFFFFSFFFGLFLFDYLFVIKSYFFMINNQLTRLSLNLSVDRWLTLTQHIETFLIFIGFFHYTYTVTHSLLQFASFSF